MQPAAPANEPQLVAAVVVPPYAIWPDVTVPGAPVASRNGPKNSEPALDMVVAATPPVALRLAPAMFPVALIARALILSSNVHRPVEVTPKSATGVPLATNWNCPKVGLLPDPPSVPIDKTPDVFCQSNTPRP